MTFAPQSVAWPPGTFGASDLFGVAGAARAQFGTVPTPDALVYLVCRFGYPRADSDPEKEVCEYLLTTPHPDVQVSVSLLARRADFGLVVPAAWQWKLRDVDVALAATQAYTATLRSLTLPVLVRDVYLGLCGEMEDDDLPMQADPEDPENGTVIEAPRAASAGRGVRAE